MRIGKERCERKAYPHRVCPDRNRVNGAKKRLCLMECNMKTRYFISKSGIVFDLQSANLDFDP